jgi:uncharacterized protein (TIGR03067 family)
MDRRVKAACRCLAGALLALQALAFAPAPFLVKPQKLTPAERVVQALFGDWHNPAQPSVVVNITPTEFAYVNSGVRNNVYKLTLDVTVTPYRYDIRREGANYVGIWKLEGDKLTVHYNGEQPMQPGQGRPTAFGVNGITEVYYRKGPGK